MEYIPQSRARTDAYEELEAARIKSEHIGIMQEANRAIQVAAFCDSVSHITRRLDAFETRRDARIKADQEQRDLEEQQRKADRIKQALDALEEETHGELTSHPANDPYEKQITATGPTADQNPGDLPAELAEDPPEEPLPQSRPPTARNPVAVSLGSMNKE
jgi:hypothetical protein